jgi:hypothetical protein
VQNTDVIVDVVDKGNQRRASSGLGERDHIADPRGQHLQVVEVAEESLQPFELLHRTVKTKSPDAFGDFERVPKLLERDADAVERTSRIDHARTKHRGLEFMGAPVETRRNPSGAVLDRAGRIEAGRELPRSDAEVVDVHGGDGLTHRAARV